MSGAAVLLLGGLAFAGWAAALVLALSMRRRLALVADAEHELRGAAAAIGLAAERVSRTGAGATLMSLVALQLDRMSAALADLAAARARGATPPRDPQLDAGRLAQVLGNLIANATEHGVGPVDVRASRSRGAVRLEIRNRSRPRALDDLTAARAPGRGRGLAIAERAARELGGRLTVASRDGVTEATVELPAEGGAAAGDAAAAAMVPGEEAAAAMPPGEAAAAAAMLPSDGCAGAASGPATGALDRPAAGAPEAGASSADVSRAA